ncbi:hypothetical protein HWV62_31373 [Athelia sp. TMB]|nr:hypothetical protein HWV62_31373 [Athelia sp. TMB]
MGSNKPRGLQAARKLRNDRRENRWADKTYKKRALGNIYKTSPTGGSSHAKGIVLEKVGVEAKQPNSAIRKCVRVQLIKNGKKVTAFVPNDGCLNFVDENDEVLISGFGRRGKAKGDIPGVRFKVVKVSGVGLLALWKEKKVRLDPICPHPPSLIMLYIGAGEAQIINAGCLLLHSCIRLYVMIMFAPHNHAKIKTHCIHRIV